MSAKFQIEYIGPTQKKVYIFSKLINTDVRFQLTDSSYLGEFPIVASITQPRALDKEGKPRFDLYAFTLKRPQDKNQIKINDILELRDDHVEVIDSFKLSDGRIITLLKCYPGKLERQLELADDINKKWVLRQYLIITGSFDTYEKIRKEEKENIFQYLLEPQGHDTKPIKGSKLRITTRYDELC